MNHAIYPAVGCRYFLPGCYLRSFHQMVNGSTHLITALLLIYRPRKDERLSWLTWPVADGLPTSVVTHQLQVECRTGKVRQSGTNVLPLCYATNLAVTKQHTHTHTHTFNGSFSGTTRVSRYQKGKTNLDFTEQETVSGSGIRWALCKSARCSRQITTPAPHHSVFYRPDALPAAQRTASKHWRPKLYVHKNTTWKKYNSVYKQRWTNKHSQQYSILAERNY